MNTFGNDCTARKPCGETSLTIDAHVPEARMIVTVAKQKGAQPGRAAVVPIPEGSPHESRG